VARRVRLVGLGGVLLGLGCILLGLWGFVYACDTETRACKGAVAWSTGGALLYWGGWALMILGAAFLIVILVAWILRSVRG
jgi:Na+/phosphate symporter